jgi:peptidoglycan/LPS O-acetylase OafA/YrhL
MTMTDERTAGRWGPVIETRFDPHANGLTPLRLGLALAILAAHVWDAGAFGPDPVETLIGRQGIVGTLSVYAFFALSGFLLTQSRERQGRVTFLTRRAARIMPGYWFAVLLTAVVVGAWYVAAAWFPFQLVGTIEWGPWEDHAYANVNASLWTLWAEIACYVLLALSPVRWLGRTMAVTAVALVALSFLPELQFRLTVLAGPSLAFVSGAALATWRRQVPLVGLYAVACLLAAVAAFGTLAGMLLAPIAVGYVAVWAAATAPFRSRTDLSYGTYLLAFPVTQILLESGMPGPWPLLAATMALTLALAAVSWFAIERPSLVYGARLAPTLERAVAAATRRLTWGARRTPRPST